MRSLGVALGTGVASWAGTTRFMECGGGCDGIHPDEPIVVGAEALIAFADSINDTVRIECKLTSAFIADLLESFNENDPPPRAKLEVRQIDVEKYSGRRLVLRLLNVHALAGGGYTGPKWMDTSGELWDGPSLVASFESHATGGVGLTTCKSARSLSENSAGKIAEWLRSPGLEAKLK